MIELEHVLDELASEAPVERASWDDVRRRSGHGHRHPLALGALVVVTAAAILASPAIGIDRLTSLFVGEPVEPSSVPAESLQALSAMIAGDSPRAPVPIEKQFARVRAAQLRQIAVRDGRVYFAADRAGGGFCGAVGRTGDSRLFGSILCSPDFPSASRPILDRSAFIGPPAEPRVTRLEGFAADGVASVAVLTAGGDVAAVTPVEHNVYLRTEDLPDERVAGIVALAPSGEVIHTYCLAADC